MTDDKRNRDETPLAADIRKLKPWRRPRGETPFELAARILITPPKRKR